MADIRALSRSELIVECKQMKDAGLLDPSVRCNGTTAYLVEQIESSRKGRGRARSRSPSPTKGKVDTKIPSQDAYNNLRTDLPRLAWYDNVDYAHLATAVAKLVGALEWYTSLSNGSLYGNVEDAEQQLLTEIRTIVRYGAPGAQVLAHYTTGTFWETVPFDPTPLLVNSLLSQHKLRHSLLLFWTDAISNRKLATETVSRAYRALLGLRLFPLASIIRINYKVNDTVEARRALAGLMVGAYLVEPNDEAMLSELEQIDIDQGDLRNDLDEGWRATMEDLYGYYATDAGGRLVDVNDPYVMVAAAEALLRADERLGTGLLSVPLDADDNLPVWLTSIDGCLDLLTHVEGPRDVGSGRVYRKPLHYVNEGLVNVIVAVLSQAIAHGHPSLRDVCIGMVDAQLDKVDEDNLVATVALERIRKVLVGR